MGKAKRTLLLGATRNKRQPRIQVPLCAPARTEKSRTKNRLLSMKVFLKPWPCLAARSSPRNVNVRSTEKDLEAVDPMNKSRPSRDAIKRELAAETLQRCGEVHFVARGTSMLPSIYPSDRLTVKFFGSTAPRHGDVVLCRLADGFRVHRIVEILEHRAVPRYVLRGDALLGNDPPVARDAILGRVHGVRRGGNPVHIDSAGAIRHRVLQWFVCRSAVVTVLLLAWHAVVLRGIPRIASVLRKPRPANRKDG